MVVKVRYVRSAPVTNTLAQVREKSSIFPHTHVMFAPVTNALDTLLAYVAVQGYLALLRYIHLVWQKTLRTLGYTIHEWFTQYGDRMTPYGDRKDFAKKSRKKIV